MNVAAAKPAPRKGGKGKPPPFAKKGEKPPAKKKPAPKKK